MSVINFPNQSEATENTIQNEIAQQNKQYVDSVLIRMAAEHAALVRTQDPNAIALGDLILKLLEDIIDDITDFQNNNLPKDSQIQIPYFINQCMQSVNAILAGGIISPLTGVDEEWHDITAPEDVGKEFKIVYRGVEYSITIESVQVNVRYPKIYRLNGDNRFAHRIDYFQFHNAVNPDNINLTQDSIRFIQFPYTMQSLHSHCILENNQIVDYLDFDHNDIANGLVYPDQSNDDPHSYVIAPKIPFHMLEEAGISVIDEVKAYDDAIDAQNSQYDFSDEENIDDEFDFHSEEDM